MRRHLPPAVGSLAFVGVILGVFALVTAVAGDPRAAVSLASPPQRTALIPDNAALVVANRDGRVVVLDRDGHQLDTLFTVSNQASVTALAVAPDHRTVWYATLPNPATEGACGTMHERDMPTKLSRRQTACSRRR